MPDLNIDTDAIFPARFLLVLEKEGMGDYLFRDRRYDETGSPVADFVLNRAPFDTARIIVAGDGFGCGSSREQAVWALEGFGIRAVVAPGFGDIFRANCLKNGILPVQVPPDVATALGDAAERGAVFDIDLETRSLSVDGSVVTGFGGDAAAAEALWHGWDETETILQKDGDAIAAFEARHRAGNPWLFLEEQGA
jgi:3-isopropylmalate/(R)-2-methylmalate dehydratase small subunit